MEAIKFVENDLSPVGNFPAFRAGDTIIVYYKIKEGAKERIQHFQGVVLQKRNAGANEMFTIRKMSGNVGVERIFPMASPMVDKIEIVKHGHVKRARIFYLRSLTGKSARIKEKKRVSTK